MSPKSIKRYSLKISKYLSLIVEKKQLSVIVETGELEDSAPYTVKNGVIHISLVKTLEQMFYGRKEVSEVLDF